MKKVDKPALLPRPPQDEPPPQDAELAALLARVAQAEDIPEPLVEALSQLLQFLYRQESLAGGDPSGET